MIVINTIVQKHEKSCERLTIVTDFDCNFENG